MISNQKNTVAEAEMSPEIFLITFEEKLKGQSDFATVEMLMKKLQFLGSNFDPFGAEVSGECQAIMEQLQLTNHFRNPYLATNILLRLLDKTEEKLNSLKQ
jgi:hypothetical protein